MDDWQNVGSDIEARNRAVTNYLPLVRYVAMQVRAPTHIEFDDLVSYGYVGLIGAVERYDPSRGVKFTTFAVQRIRGAILDELRAQDWAPRRVRRNGREVAKAVDALNERLQREPTLLELAETLGMAPTEVQRVLAELGRANHLTLDIQTGPEENLRPGVYSDWIEDRSSAHVAPEDNIIQEDHVRRVASSLEMLRANEQIIMALYYFEDMTFLQIAELLGVTESRVFQVHSGAMMSLRSLAMA